MELLRQFIQISKDVLDRLLNTFSGLFEYFIALGVRQETLIVILVGGGIALALILIALVQWISGGRSVQGRRLEAEVPLEGEVEHPLRGRLPLRGDIPGRDELSQKPVSSRFSKILKTRDGHTLSDSDSDDLAEGWQGFTIFKKRPTEDGEEKSFVESDPVVAQLVEIEREMLALKELYQGGHLNLELYVSESKALYEKAKNLQ